MKILAGALKHPNCKLQVLDASHNQIGDNGTIAIAEAIEHPNCKLKTLNLESNYISSNGTKALLKAMKTSTCTVHQLDLSRNVMIEVGYFRDAVNDLQTAGKNVTLKKTKR